MIKDNLIDIANTRISIHYVCRLVGVDIPDYGKESKSYKVKCMNGELYHSDGGDDPSMRVYSDTNTAFCFRCQTSFTPVWMFASFHGITSRQAAKDLLDLTGYKTKTMKEQLEELYNKTLPPPDLPALATALKVYCSRVNKDWQSLQFSKNISESLSRCLSALDVVTTSEEAEIWLERSKLYMKKVLS